MLDVLVRQAAVGLEVEEILCARTNPAGVTGTERNLIAPCVMEVRAEIPRVAVAKRRLPGDVAGAVGIVPVVKVGKPRIRAKTAEPVHFVADSGSQPLDAAIADKRAFHDNVLREGALNAEVKVIDVGGAELGVDHPGRSTRRSTRHQGEDIFIVLGISKTQSQSLRSGNTRAEGFGKRILDRLSDGPSGQIRKYDARPAADHSFSVSVRVPTEPESRGDIHVVAVVRIVAVSYGA